MIKKFVGALASSALLLAGLAVVGTASPAQADVPTDPNYCVPATSPSVASDAHYESLFTRSGPGWTGADGGVSTLLPDGRDSWIFSDTWLGQTTGISPNRTRDIASTPFVRSSMLLQTGDNLTLNKEAAAAVPTSLIPSSDGTWWWPNDPVVEGNVLAVPVYQMTDGGAEPFPFVFTGTQGIATFTLPGLNFVGITPIATDPALPIYGQSIVQSGGYNYIYGGDSEGGLSSFTKVARVPVGQLTNASAWQWSTGTDWSSDPHDAQDIASGNPQAVVQRASGYAMFSIPNFSNQMTVSYACDPMGPWSSAQPAYTLPQVAGNEFAYGSAAHPESDDPNGKLLVSYDTNSLDPADVSKVDTYRPHFIRVGLAPAVSQESDLAVTSISETPVGVRPGQVTTFHATLKNVGAAATPVDAVTGVGFYIDGKRVAASSSNATPLQPGASLSVTGTWTATAGTHALIAKADDTGLIHESNEANNSSTASSFTVVPWPTAPIRINAGGPAWKDPAGHAWSADTSYSGGATAIYWTAVAGSIDGFVMQTERSGMSGYHVPIANGTYHLSLYFSEDYWTKKGARVFSVTAEGVKIVNNLDIFARVGKNKALVLKYTVTVKDNSLDLGFTASKDRAKVGGIEITS
ncbi:MAG TPA: DUF5005 domain-containing protein [Frankiaceae bacterium]|nr:DUF5005 domain-containing protein [Frankiaceae bacterium]